jgi:hypothetical protein
MSDEAARKGLAVTLFERLQQQLGEEASEMLTVQYRMNTDISDWSSGELYEVSSWAAGLWGRAPKDPGCGGGQAAGLWGRGRRLSACWHSCLDGEPACFAACALAC